MSEMDSGGVHSHPHTPHDHEDIRAQIDGIKYEIAAREVAMEAEAAAATSAVAAEVAAEEAFDARAAFDDLNNRMAALADELRASSAPVIIDTPAPVVEEPMMEEPPPAEEKPQKRKKKTGLSWFE